MLTFFAASNDIALEVASKLLIIWDVSYDNQKTTVTYVHFQITYAYIIKIVHTCTIDSKLAAVLVESFTFATTSKTLKSGC